MSGSLTRALAFPIPLTYSCLSLRQSRAAPVLAWFSAVKSPKLTAVNSLWKIARTNRDAKPGCVCPSRDWYTTPCIFNRLASLGLHKILRFRSLLPKPLLGNVSLPEGVRLATFRPDSAKVKGRMRLLTRHSWGESCAGFDFCCGSGPHLWHGDTLRARLRTSEIRRRSDVIENVFLIAICVLLLGYLLMALLKPEKF